MAEGKTEPTPKKVERKFMFPEHGVTIVAETRKEAEEKLAKTLKERKNDD